MTRQTNPVPSRRPTEEDARRVMTERQTWAALEVVNIWKPKKITPKFVEPESS